ncbi:MAG: trypsin-like peptidase domain-containing protein [Planctomycetota bacterium]
MPKLLSPILVVVLAVLALALRPAEPRSLALELSAAFEDVAEEASPAVLQVLTYGSQGRGRRLVARGSGVIVGAEGIAVTNHHVVEPGDEVSVVLADGRELPVRLRGVDDETDLAVLELPAGEYPTLRLVERTPRVGAWVLAFGNPRGLGASVTAGIVSGHGRKGLGIATFESFLQTDATIHAGNSGGPLTDLTGSIVGINTARGLGGEEGINFAIPADMVADVVADILTHGRVRRGWLGVRMRVLSGRASRIRGLEDRRHVAIREALPGGPAEAAGLREGDVILAIDGVRPTDDRDLLERVASYPPGALLALEVLRGDEVEEIEVRLGERIAGLAREARADEVREQ